MRSVKNGVDAHITLKRYEGEGSLSVQVFEEINCRKALANTSRSDVENMATTKHL